jgi:hypothetical protein
MCVPVRIGKRTPGHRCRGGISVLDGSPQDLEGRQRRVREAGGEVFPPFAAAPDSLWPDEFLELVESAERLETDTRVKRAGLERCTFRVRLLKQLDCARVFSEQSEDARPIGRTVATVVSRNIPFEAFDVGDCCSAVAPNGG